MSDMTLIAYFILSMKLLTWDITSILPAANTATDLAEEKGASITVISDVEAKALDVNQLKEES